MSGTVAIGFFDGVHLGHRAIVAGADVALTFDVHPLSVLAPDRAPRLVMSPSERLAALEDAGVREVRMLTFDRALAKLDPEDFISRYLGAETSAVRCGADWRFGRAGAGDAETLRRRGISVTVVPYATYAGSPVSSTRIRAALEAGEITDANAMLSRSFTVSGRVFRGKGLGRGLGFPTVNVRPANAEGFVRLPHGVYVVRAYGRRALANFGLAPTCRERAWTTPTWEIHFPGGDFEPALSVDNAPCIFELTDFIRPERAFASLDELKKQLESDVENVLRD